MNQYEVGRPRVDDAQKLFEINKQLTTLSAGSAVLIATFMKDIFPETAAGTLNLVGSAKAAIFFAFGAFFLATIFAVVAMLPFIPINKVGTGVSVFFFLVGICIFVVVVWLSLNVPEVTPKPTVVATSSP
jgi:hypothetical protein